MAKRLVYREEVQQGCWCFLGLFSLVDLSWLAITWMSQYQMLHLPKLALGIMYMYTVKFELRHPYDYQKWSCH